LQFKTEKLILDTGYLVSVEFLVGNYLPAGRQAGGGFY